MGPNGETCTSRCVFAQGIRSLLQLTAVPAPGYALSGWSGDCIGTAPICPLSATHASTVQATFVSTGSLSITVAGRGGVVSSPAGISCGQAALDCDATFPNGQLVTLTPTPAAAATFDGWGGPCAQYGTAPCQLQVGASTGVTATFRHATPATGPETLSVSHGTTTIVSAPAILASCAASDPCSATTPSGTAVTLEAGGPFVAGDGATPVVMWSGDCVGSWPVCRAVVDDPTSVTVTELTRLATQRAAPAADRLGLLVQTVVSGGGAIRAPAYRKSCPHQCNWYLPGGAWVSIVAVPSGHHRFLGWRGGFCRPRGRRCSLRIGADESVAAVFR